MSTVKYPATLRRLRVSSHIRELTASFHLSHKSFIQPLFVNEKNTARTPLAGLEGIYAETIDSVLTSIKNDIDQGVTKFLLFPVPEKKVSVDFDFSFASRVVSAIKSEFGEAIWLASDLCLCSYTTHGHCGILNSDHTRLLNDASVQVLVNYAEQLALAGVDCIAPSDMMDGRIGAIRSRLNEIHLDHVSIMSYSAKFSSQWYGPFRDACHSAPNTHGIKDRKTYQISPFTIEDAISSSLRDEMEGADILMVKPAGLYTDVIAALKEHTRKPLAAYHVSGEYASIESMVQQGYMNREAAHLEVWSALVRSGASMIISYASRNAKEWIEKKLSY
jgi:porphobilinogen synthase